jgi:protein-S-isoprenylcysteine O-methyltransferase Ste14
MGSPRKVGARASGRSAGAIGLVVGVVSSGLLVWAMFALAGGFDWWEGWLYVGTAVVTHTLSALFIWRRDPELLRRRGAGPGEGTKTWDRIWLAVFGIQVIGVLVVAALDARRPYPPDIPVWLVGVGVSLYVACVVLVTAAMAANTFFEKTVRIQHDRGHRVVSGGPYAVVRHPGYVGVILGFGLGAPLILRSLHALALGGALIAWLVVRTALEDGLLRRELEGYAEYAKRVRYRLFPGIW